MKTRFTLLFLLLCGIVSAQVQFKVTYDDPSETYQFILVPSVTWSGAMATTSNAQVSLRVPTGNFTVANLQANYGNWNHSTTVHAPQEAPDYSYVIFAPQGIITNIPYQAGQETVVFTFQNTGDCTGALEVVNNDTDPMVPNNSQNIQAGNLLVTLGGGPGQNTFSGEADPGGADCSSGGPVGTCGVAISDVSSTSPSACGLADGSITVTAQSSGLPLQYTIDNGVSWQADPTFTGLTAGAIFVVKVRDVAAICEETWGSLELDAPDPATINGTSTTDPGCGVADGSITIDATVNGSGSLTYSRDGGLTWQPSATFTNLTPGTYTVLVRNGNGSCQKKVGDFTLTEDCGPTGPACPVTFHLEMEPAGNFLFSITPDVDWNFPQNITSTAQITLRAPTGGFTVDNLQSRIPSLSWSQNSRQNAPAEAPQYDYISFGLNNFGTQDIPFVAGQKVALFTFENNGACTGNLVELIDNDTDPFLPPNSQNANVGQQLTVSGWGGSGMPICIDTNFPTDCQGVSCPPVSVSPDNSAICAGETVTLEATSGGGTYSWSPAAGLSCTDCPNPTANPTATTTYTVTVDDGNGCVGTAMAVVNVIDGPLADFNAADGCVSQAISFTNTSTNDASVMEWVWDFGDNSSTQDRDPSHTYLLAGNYTVTLEARTANGCISTHSQTLTIVGEVDPQLGADQSICQGGGAQLQASGGVSYQWSPADGLSSTTASNPIANPTVTTVYTVEVTNAQGCTGTGEITVRVDPIPSIADVRTVDPTSCDNPNGTVEVTASVATGGLLYSIDGGQTWQPDALFTGLGAGNYDVQVANDQGTCGVNYLASNVTLSSAAGPAVANVQHTDPAACEGTAGTISVQTVTNEPGTQYSIDGGQTYQADNVFADVAAGTYTVQVANADLSCVSVHPAPVELTDATSLSITDVASTNPSGCATDDGSITVSAAGGNSIEYSIDGGQTWQPTPEFTGLSTGSYQVAVREFDCADTHAAAVALSAPTGPSVTAVSGNDPLCAGASTTLSVTFDAAIDSYTIAGGQYADDSVQGNTVTFTATSGSVNDYSLDVVAAGGCAGATTVSLDVSSAPQAAIVVAAGACVEAQVQLNYSGNAAADATLDWDLGGAELVYSSPATVQQPAGAQLIVRWLTPGTQTVSLTVDDNGCTGTGSESIELVDFDPAVSITTTEPTGCGAANGALTVDLSDADAYTYLWTAANGATYTTQNLTDLPGGTFELVITEPTGGCSYSTSATLTETDFFEVQSLTTTADNDCGDAVGSITATATPGVGPYLFLLYRSDNMATVLDTHNGAAEEHTFKELEAADYTVMVETQSGCDDQADATVAETAVAALVQDVQYSDATCDTDNGTIAVSFGPDLGTYSYELRQNGSAVLTGTDDNQPTAQLDALAPGDYQLVVTNALGCAQTSDVTIAATTPQTDVSWAVEQPGCDSEDGSISLTGAAGLSYAWSADNGSSPAPAATVTDLAPGVYTVTITDANGCTATQTHILAASSAAAVSAEVLTGAGCADDAGSVAVSLDVSADYTYTVLGTGLTGTFNGTDHVIDGLPGGDYTITFAVANSNDCESVATVSIAEHTDARFDTQVLDPTACGSGDGQLCLTLTAGEGPFTVQTDQGTAPVAFTNDGCITGLSGGTVNLTITDGTGCLSTLSVALDYDALPTIDPAAFELGRPVCAGDATGSITAVNGVSYTVVDELGTLLGTTPLTNLAPGIYTVQQTQGDCTAELALEISAPLMLTATATVQAEDCDGNNGVLSVLVSGGVEPYTYEWSNGAATSSLSNVSADQTLDVLIFDAFGCQTELTGLAVSYDCTECEDVFALDTYTVQQQADRTDICLPLGNLDLNDYELLLDGVPYTRATGICVDSFVFYGYGTLTAQGDGPYRLESWRYGVDRLTDLDFADIDELVAAMNAADPLGNWTHDTDAQTITGGNGYAYGALTLTHSASANTFTYALNYQAVTNMSLELAGPGTYELLTVSLDGCEDELLIEVLPPAAPRDLIIYTGFSPNDDGVNEVFTIENIEYFPNNTLRIFNRWGNEVYSATGYRNDSGWRGDYFGEDLPNGTYFYVLHVDEDQYSGYVQIHR